jgi:hypothetical protein
MGRTCFLISLKPVILHTNLSWTFLTCVQERFPEEHTAIDRFFELMHSCSRPTFYYIFIKVKYFLRILITGS